MKQTEKGPKTPIKKAAAKKSAPKPKEVVLASAEKSAEIASYYGFTIIDTPTVTKDDLQKTRRELEIEPARCEDELHLVVHPEEKVAILRTYLEKDLVNAPQPVMFYYEGTMLQEGEKPKKHKPDEHIFHMDMIGSNKSIAEATLIKIAYELLREEGYEKLSVSINSIGDKESMNRFCKELANFYRKNINDLSPHCRQLLKRDPFEVYECTDEKCKGGKEHCPNPISYLTEQSRIHFKEVLEYLETLSIPFEIHNFLVCNRKMWSQTAFALYDEHGSELARGVRYNAVAKKIGFKKDTGAIGISVRYTRSKKAQSKAPVVKQPLIYFIQLGFEAKLKSLIVLEILRKAKVPIAQALNRDKIGVQIQSAETDRIPYTIIMGQKEAMENSVIVREMRTRSQESVPFSQLADYVKKLMESREKGK